ncbi:sensor domain-containing diguanylate cyclase [Meiothermus cerbereus]|mgnify:CR=1 FL=1|jgi:diguanylate cyclase (GGDEF)-like protein|uniref:sensor domain-containing diguanylate cyclase n=1 Tax=Meiothermus cerbereus TaxID=65552 RepID=UPI0006873B74|nr:sensor domain-containing diguanylate cyclase [Meiothermus cerbereus]
MSTPALFPAPDILHWLNQLPEPVVWLDEKGQVGWCNPAAVALIPDPSPAGKPLESWFQPVVRGFGRLEPADPPQNSFRPGLWGLAGKQGRWFQVSLAPYKNGQLCILHEVTQTYNQALAYATSLEVLSSLLTQEEKFEDILARVLKTAVEVVPGAEAGSLTLLEDGRFRFVAQIGFDPSLMQHALDYQQELAWYGLGEEAWLLGQPRLLVAPHIHERTQQQVPDELEMFHRVGKLTELKATVTVPIVLQGQVMGTLNLDSFSSTEAFPPQSLAIAQTFALQAATVLYGLLTRHHLSGLALSDALTGLGNRHALEEGFPKLKAQAERLGLPLTLIYWDMDGLKRVNDQHGHAAGDQAIKALATALRSTFRQEDQVFRIGGDEFVSLHLALSLDEVPEAVQRVRMGIQVEVSAGAVAIRPTMPLTEALQLADAAMYADKRRLRDSLEL